MLDCGPQGSSFDTPVLSSLSAFDDCQVGINHQPSLRFTVISNRVCFLRVFFVLCSVQLSLNCDQFSQFLSLSSQHDTTTTVFHCVWPFQVRKSWPCSVFLLHLFLVLLCFCFTICCRFAHVSHRSYTQGSEADARVPRIFRSAVSWKGLLLWEQCKSVEM